MRHEAMRAERVLIRCRLVFVSFSCYLLYYLLFKCCLKVDGSNQYLAHSVVETSGSHCPLYTLLDLICIQMVKQRQAVGHPCTKSPPVHFLSTKLRPIYRKIQLVYLKGHQVVF